MGGVSEARAHRGAVSCDDGPGRHSVQGGARRHPPRRRPPDLTRFGLAVLLRRAGGAAHRNAVDLDDVARVGATVLGILKPAARIALALERLRIALLLVGAVLLTAPETASQHEGNLPRASLH